MAIKPWDVVAAAIRPVVVGVLRPSVTGLGHIPGGGGVILAANHLSYVDIFLMGCVSPRTPRFLGKTELTGGLLGPIVDAMGMVAVERGRGDLAIVHQVAYLLGDGAVIGIFPEGTRTPDGRMYRFRSGVARAAAMARVPTVPVTIQGTNRIWSKGAKPTLRLQPPGAVTIAFHDPLEPPANTGAARRAFTARLADVIASGCDQPVAACFAPLSA